MLLQMAEQNRQGGAEPIMLSTPTCARPRQAYNLYIITNSNADCDSYARPGSHK